MLAAGVGVLWGESEATLRYSLLSARGLVELLLTTGLASLPITLPLGLVGGALTARVLSQEDGRRPLRSWVSRGAAWGLGLGFAGTALWFGVMSLGEGRVPLPILGFPFLGALCGAIIGSLVGAFCSIMLQGRDGAENHR
jgi:hypothetical protein